MNLHSLETFLTILEEGSLVGASRRLHVTQSTVTARLKSLEAELGQTLIHRNKSGATPTAAGLRLRQNATTMVELWNQARQQTTLPQAIDSVANLGCHPDLWPHRGERLFDRVRQQHSSVAVSITHGGQSELASLLTSGLVDLILTYSPATGARQRAIALPTDTLILVSTNPASPIRFDPGYVFADGGEAFGREHAAAYSDANMATVSFGSAVLALEHLRLHGGSAYIPRRIAAPLIKTGELHKLRRAPEFQRPAWIVLNEVAAAEWDWLDDAVAVVVPEHS